MSDLPLASEAFLAALYPPATLSDNAISALARAVKIREGALFARRDEILELTREFVSQERAAKNERSPNWHDVRALRTRRRKIADGFSACAEKMATLVRLLKRDAEWDYPLAESLELQCDLRTKDLEVLAREATKLFADTARIIRRQTPSRSKRRSESPKSRGRPPQTALQSFAAAMFSLCDAEGGVLTGGDDDRVRRIAKGLEKFLQMVPEAPNASAGSINALLTKSGVRSTRPKPKRRFARHLANCDRAR